MKRELSIERRGDYFHMRLHRYMGPWEGHQIEHALDLEEVAPPPDGESYEQVLGPNQAYLWREMSFEPELHALITADRLEKLALFVRDREVEVIEGADLLPTPKSEAHIEYEVKDDTPEGSYVALIEKRHASVWQQGPRTMIGAVLIRLVPALLLVFVVVIASRHYGDKYTTVDVDETFARVQSATPEQGAIASLLRPDYSHLVRNEIRSVSFASGNRMLLGDGNYIAFDGVADVMPWLNRVSMSRTPIRLDVNTEGGTAKIVQVQCGGEVLARDLTMRRIGRLPPSESAPLRATTAVEGNYRSLSALPAGRDADAEIEALRGQRLSLTGALVMEESRLVLRTPSGSGVVLDASNAAPKMRSFLSVFTGDPGPVIVDFALVQTFAWTNATDPARARETTQLIGEGVLHSASAQKHHVQGRR